jgi:hypothetical protein
MDRIKGYGHGGPGRIRGYGYETADVNILREEKYLRVTPSTPQTLVWMVPGNEIVYGVESNTVWNIE